MLTAQDLQKLEDLAEEASEDELRGIVMRLIEEIRRLRFGMSP